MYADQQPKRKFLPTCTGRRVHIAAPLPDEIDIEDIAHGSPTRAASRATCRFITPWPSTACSCPNCSTTARRAVGPAARRQRGVSARPDAPVEARH
jgi:hypothetical protein